jgi:hypothetical protein
VTTNPAGREVESPDVLINGEESNLDQLRALAEAVVEVGRMYRAAVGSE